MIILNHELKRSRVALIVWTVVISFMLAVCVLIYPEMSSQMADLSDMFADMGSFSSAFGMDQINFGEFIGYFGIECGNTLGLGGAFFAAIVGISALAKEEKEHTAEFLLTHPISRTRVVFEKYVSVIAQVIIMNLVVAGVTLISILAIGETDEVGTVLLIFLAYLLMQIEISSITFGISSYIRRGGMGIGLGIAVMFYFMNIISNITEDAKIIKYITPFSYTDGATIISDGVLEWRYLVVGVIFTIIGVISAFVKYSKKDIY